MSSEHVTELKAQLYSAEREIERLEKELAEARATITRIGADLEHDRSLVADGVSAIKKAIAAREWLRLGRGSYEYDDDRWRDEFGSAIDEITEALGPLKKLAANLADCPTDWPTIQAARIDWKSRADAAEASLTALRVALCEAAKDIAPTPWTAVPSTGEWIFRDRKGQYLGGFVIGRPECERTARFILRASEIARTALSATAPDAVKVGESSPNDLRAKGWSVAVHNDYRQEGVQNTFWLFTSPSGLWVKGEGLTDAEALNQCRAAVTDLTGEDKP